MHRILPLLAALLLPLSLLAQTPKPTTKKPGTTLPALKAPDSKSFFPQKDLMPLGVYYYPEAWPKRQWDRDLAGIAKLGFTYTHFAEFAWAQMEPEEGRYTFGWLDTAVALAAKHGLKVIMCTPTPTPPAWMATKYPDILVTNKEGRVMRHGTRTQGSWSSERYRRFTERICAELGRRYGNDSRIWGWQLDNEPSHYSVEYDYSPAAQANWIKWLKTRYKTLEAVNMAWGASTFWSQRYTAWGQVRIPNERELVANINPHQLLDFRRFNAEECADFLRLQQQTLRRYITPQQWITSNFMGFNAPTDMVRSRDLDAVSYTTYPVAGYSKGIGEQGQRIGDPYMIPWLTDFFQSINGRTGVMELQPGQVNWGRNNPQPLPGVVRAWLYASFAGGSKFACSYRYRQPLTGGEQYHYGMVGTDGVTPLPGGLEYSMVCKEMAQLQKLYDPARAADPADYAARRIGIAYYHDNIWDLRIQRQSAQFDPMLHIQGYYQQARRLGSPVSLVFEHDSLSPQTTPVLVAPCYQLVDSALIRRWRRYAEAGGTLVLTCRTGQKTRQGHFLEGPFQAPILGLIGGKVDMYDMIDPGEGHLTYQGKTYPWNNWADILTPDSASYTLATYTDQFYKGKSAVTRRKLGKGYVYYIGVDTDNGDLEREVLSAALAERGTPARPLADGLLVDYRDGFWVATNLSSTVQQAPVPTGAEVIIGQAALEPAGVCVWRER